MRHQVPRHHHFIAPAAEVAPHWTTTATTSRASTGSLISDNVVYQTTSYTYCFRRTSEGAEPVRHSLAVLGHLDLATALRLQAGDLLTASADDQAHHVVGHHHCVSGDLLAPHPRCSGGLHVSVPLVTLLLVEGRLLVVWT